SSNLFTSTNWTYEKQVGFYAFFPQLKVFATSAYKAIKDYSKEVVKVDIFAEGDGTESNPYIVYNAFDMEAISNMTYAGYSLSRTYFKVADSVEYIDLGLTPNFRAIGYATTNYDGNFDGNNTAFELELNNTLQYQGL